MNINVLVVRVRIHETTQAAIDTSLREIARASGYTINELSILNKFLGLQRKRGPKPGVQIANE
jgi:hypothetical protein